MLENIFSLGDILNSKLKGVISNLNCLLRKLAYGMVSNFEKVCDCRQADDLEDEKTRTTQTQWIANLGSWTYDLASQKLDLSEEVYQIYGLCPNTSTPTYENFIELVHKEDRAFFKDLVGQVISHKKVYNIEHRIISQSGQIGFVHQIIRLVYNEEDHPIRILGTVQDITSLKQQEEEIRSLSYYDQLTGLPNRLMFLEEIDCLTMLKCSKHKEFAVLLLDLDRFKTVNDSLGHDRGDLLLEAVSQRLKYNVTDVYNIYRLGGDEFAIIVNKTSLVEKTAEEILSLISEPFVVDGYEIFITTSTGIAYYPKDGNNGSILIKNADAAMYEAKEMGKNQFVYYSYDINEKAAEQLFIENELRNAIERDEFYLDYQQQVDASRGNIIVAEALIRWQHPKMGLVSPGKFIPLSEELGLIVEIGEWVLRTACAQNKAWQEEGYPPIKIAVNISIRQFQRNDFVEMVKRVLKETGLDPKYLELEITESIAMDDIERVMLILRQLKDLGLSIAIDDFGTGYSSLNYLKELSIDVLKIDQTFINRIPSEQKNSAIVRSIINMAHSLGLKVVAEGVETEDQLSFLQMSKCNLIQGFLFNKPVSPELFWAKI